MSRSWRVALRSFSGRGAKDSAVLARARSAALTAYGESSWPRCGLHQVHSWTPWVRHQPAGSPHPRGPRSEEHTSELQSLRHLVCRLLLEKKKKKERRTTSYTHRT